MFKLSEQGQGIVAILIAIALVTIIAIFGSELLAWLLSFLQSTNGVLS